MKRLLIRTLLGAVALAFMVTAATPARATARDDILSASSTVPSSSEYDGDEDETYSPFDEQLVANAEAADETTDPTGDEGTTPQLIDHADDLWAGAQEVARRVRQIAMLLAAGLIATGVMIMMFGGIGGGEGPQPARIIAFAMMGVVGILVWPEVMTKTKELCDATARYIDTFQFDHEQSGIASATVRTFEDMGKGIGVSLEKPFWWQLMVAPYTQGLVYLAWFLAVFFYVLYRFVWQVGWLFLYIVGPFGMAAAATGTPTGIRIAKGLYMSVLNLACWPISISILFALLNLGIRDYAQDPSSIGGKQVMVALVVALMIPVTLAFTKQFLSGAGLDTNLAAFTSQMLTMAMLGALKIAGTAIAAVPAISGAGVALGASAGAALKGMSALGGGLANAASAADEGGSGATATSGRVAPMPANDGTARTTAEGVGGATPGVGAALLGVGRAVGGAIGSVAATGAETIGNMALAAAEAGAKESGHVATRYGVSDIFGSRSGGSTSGSRRGARSSNGASGYASGGGESGGDGPPPGGDGASGPSDAGGSPPGSTPGASPSATTSSGPRTSAIGPASTSSLGAGSGRGAAPTERAPAQAPGSGSPLPSGAVDDGATTSSGGSAPPAPAGAGADDGSATGAIGSAAPAPGGGGRTQGPAHGASTPGFGRGAGDHGAVAGGASGGRAPAQRSANLTGAARIPSIEELGLGSAFGSTAGGEDAPSGAPSAPPTSTTRTTFGASAGGPGSAGSGGEGGHGQEHGSPAGGGARVSTIEVGSGAATPPRAWSGRGSAGRHASTGGAVDTGVSVVAGIGADGPSYGSGPPSSAAPSGGGSVQSTSSAPDAQASDDVIEIVDVDDGGSGRGPDVLGSSTNGSGSGGGSSSTAPRGSSRAHTINRLISNAAARVQARERPREDPADQAHSVRPPDSAF